MRVRFVRLWLRLGRWLFARSSSFRAYRYGRLLIDGAKRELGRDLDEEICSPDSMRYNGVRDVLGVLWWMSQHITIFDARGELESYRQALSLKLPTSFDAAPPPPPPPTATPSVVLPFTPRPNGVVAVDPRARDERLWVDVVARESDREYAQRIAHGWPDYYHSTHWDVVCEEFKTGECAHCRRTDRETSLHHVNSRSFGREQRDDVVELCDPCHAREEGRGLWKYRRAA